MVAGGFVVKVVECVAWVVQLEVCLAGCFIFSWQRVTRRQRGSIRSSSAEPLWLCKARARKQRAILWQRERRMLKEGEGSSIDEKCRNVELKEKELIREAARGAEPLWLSKPGFKGQGRRGVKKSCMSR